MHQLTFTRVHSYTDGGGGITAPVVLRSGETIASLVASLDTGASYCLFESAYAAEPGIDLTTGVPTRFRTANGSSEAYGHEIEIEVPGIACHSLVYFFADPSIRKNVLGRHGWLDRVRVGLVDHDRALYLASFNDDPE